MPFLFLTTCNWYAEDVTKAAKKHAKLAPSKSTLKGDELEMGRGTNNNGQAPHLGDHLKAQFRKIHEVSISLTKRHLDYTL